MALSKETLGTGLWWSLTVGSHLLAVAILVAVGWLLVGGDYIGGDGSYECYSALRDFAGPRPVEQPNFDFFDAGPPCWDEAKSRIITAAVLMPMMVVLWAAGWLAIRQRRHAGPPFGAFAVVAFIGLWAGFVGGQS